MPRSPAARLPAGLLINTWLMPVIDHMQLADVPGRHEPGTGEIGWDHVFRRIDELGYGGWIGCEYNPVGNTVTGLAWRTRYGV